MAQIFNSPPGWPKPPEGWTPPPGWAPDPSWPQAPDGWQFWVEDPFTAAVNGGSASQPTQGEQPPSAGEQPTQTMGTSPTQVMGAGASQPGLYSYAPSAGLEQPGASPYNPQSGGYQPGGPPGGGFQGGQYTSPGAPAPKSRNTLTIAVVAVVAVLVLGGIVWGLISLFSGGGEEPTAGGDPTTGVEPTDEPTTDEPTTNEPTTDEPTDDPTTDGSGGSSSDLTDLTGSDPALINGNTSGDPIVEVRLLQADLGWQPSGSSMLCSDPENGQYLGLEFEFTTLPALADESTPTYTFTGLELGAEADGVALEANGFSASLFCLNSSERPPSEMQPGETYTGWAVLDVPDSVTAATFEPLFDFTGAGGYRWVLADQ
ncbi:hypothetical protein [Pseudactinotalea sp.]|uniref:hypothetical protein n=1 Tax=Pseudactinotalea sp. TaxID=1926260 RepID=UPI003B3A2726